MNEDKEALRDAQAALLHKKESISLLSYQLRNQITIIKLGAEFIERQSEDPKIVHKQVARILKNVDRADQMIQELLNFELGPVNPPIPLARRIGGLTLVHGNTGTDLNQT